MTLIGVAVAGFLIWIGVDALTTEEDIQPSVGEYWWAVGFIAAAGLVIALSQLLGGWTKWGWPRISFNVFLLGFLPALIVGGWIVAANEPDGHWLGDHIRNWSDDIGVEGLVDDLRLAWSAFAFGIGLTFGLTFDTTGPRTEPVRWRRRRTVPAAAEDEAPTRTTDNGGHDGEPADTREAVRGRATTTSPRDE